MDMESYLLELWDKNICPNCGKGIPEGTRVGSGMKKDGGFCSLTCYASFYSGEYSIKAKKLLNKTKKNSEE